MSPRTLASVLLKCLGLFLVLNGLLGVSSAYMMYLDTGGITADAHPRALFIFQALRGLALLAVAILYFANTDLVVKLFFRDLPDTAEPPSAPFAYHAMAFSILGAWILATSLPDLASQLFAAISLGDVSHREELPAWWARSREESVAAALESALGFLLFFQSRRIAAVWYRLQPIRTSKATHDQSVR